jgi:uncharacterized protein (TIGR03643 family)
MTREIIAELDEVPGEVDVRIKAFDRSPEAVFQANAGCQRIARLCGVGPKTATAVIAARPALAVRKLDLSRGQGMSARMVERVLDPPTISEIIEMALSDHVSFDQIRALHGLGPDGVKALMRRNLKSGSYRAWRRRVRQFSDRREVYK